jgi:hypothetical protein
MALTFESVSHLARKEELTQQKKEEAKATAEEYGCS